MTELTDSTVAACAQMAEGLRANRWTADSTMDAVSRALVLSGGEPARLDCYLQLYAHAHVNQQRSRTPSRLDRRAEPMASPLDRQWTITLLDAPDGDRWVTELPDVAPEATVLYADRPFLHGDYDSFRMLSEALYIALENAPVTGCVSRSNTVRLLERVGTWLSEVSPQ
ncbi:hypothetical protein [Gordonia sp. HS-NH1]|uniref:hypothetical protein n=1 Tax=Gordonia sp. HS-NH1 TaxID=1435068 RepID=UPI0006E41CD6|nr:hypothetical protein [Gordonia sp. HS-NH1]